MCEHTNHVRSCDHPTQMLLIALLSIILLSIPVQVKHCTFLYIYNDNYYNHVKDYAITCHIIMFKIYTIMCHTCITCTIIFILLYMLYIIHFSSFGAILSLIAYHKLSHNAHNPDRLSQGAMQNTLNKRGCKCPNLWTSRAPLRRIPRDKLSYKNTSRQYCRRLGKRHKA